ncbi:hypothetical protein [Anaeromicrobium sediminis]|uniref:Uncharacterized protein n=1 Tax=Anaeromicrobium sediminis TaxID=1478221 RepID=A0A267MP18_9FIRM|nr:hypothetical protein [Anaeromicrobium sediminis]PAB61344.1 hypothetical protein CCE28_02640 [Anaeromicrobium sediminis]
MHLEELINWEGKCLKNNMEKYIELINNSYNIISILSYISNIKTPKSLAYFTFNNQIRASLIQSLLALLRNHEVQSKLMLRHAIETGMLAAYSLIEPDIEKYLINEKDGARPVKVMNKVYKFIENLFPDYSNRLKKVKDEINEFYAHGNLFNSFVTSPNRENIYGLAFFDRNRDDDFKLKIGIWQIGHIACILFDLLYEASLMSIVVERNEEISKRYSELLKESQSFRYKFEIEFGKRKL